MQGKDGVKIRQSRAVLTAIGRSLVMTPGFSNQKGVTGGGHGMTWCDDDRMGELSVRNDRLAVCMFPVYFLIISV